MTAATAFIRPPWASPIGASSLLLIGPTVEPLTLDEAKLRAGLDWPTGDPRDAMMTGFIKAARQKVEADTGLALLEQTRRVTVIAVAGDVLPMPPYTIPTVSIAADDGTAIHFDVAGSLVFPVDYSGTLTVVAGWPTPEALATEAPLLTHAVGLLAAHFATMGRDLATQPTNAFPVPFGYDDSIASYRLLRIP